MSSKKSTDIDLADARQSLAADEAWFWTPEWQAGEREAAAELERGEGEHYDSEKELLAALDAIDADR